MNAFRTLFFASILTTAACSGPSATPVDDLGVPPDQSSSVDLGTPDTGAVQADAAVDSGLPQPPSAEEYCETTVDFFCDYYLRCGRMAAADLADCRVTFLESCNAIYEPRYASYAERGLLALSAEGIDACRTHLESVDCAVQMFDLDLGCAGMWVGQAPLGDACAPGIGSFVCEPGTVCTLGLDLCGTCKEAAPVGAACGSEVRCENGAQCVDDVCVKRALPAESCADAPCVIGATCGADNFCRGFEVVRVGESCDQNRRCPYKSACLGGACVESAMLGASCLGRECASGYCDGATCVPFKQAGDACSEPRECLSLSCDGVCAEVEQACFE